MRAEETLPETWKLFAEKLPPRLSKAPLRWVMATEWFLERWVIYHLRRWAFVEFLEYAGRFGVLFAVIFYLKECPDRRDQRINQAWQVINSAQGKGGSGGRIRALEQLNADKNSLQGVNLVNAWLFDIQLPQAQLGFALMDSVVLDGANLQASMLNDAALRRASLHHSNLQKSVLLAARLDSAFLDDVNLAEADLRAANLSGAELRRVNLRGANLGGADLRGTALYEVDLTGADLRFANLAGSHLEGVSLLGANLDSLKGWREVKFLALSNVYGVLRAPDGFLPWAVDTMLAVVMNEGEWEAFLRRVKKRQETLKRVRRFKDGNWVASHRDPSPLTSALSPRCPPDHQTRAPTTSTTAARGGCRSAAVVTCSAWCCPVARVG